MPLDKDALEQLRIEPADRTAPTTAVPGWLGWALAVALAVAAIAWWWLARDARPVVRVALAESVTSANNASGAVLNATGYVVARRLATVSSKVTGKIVEVLVEEGMAVDAGQVLARLDDSTARRQLDLAVSQREVAARSLREVGVRLDEALRTLQRNRDLRADGLVSESTLDASTAEVDALRARLVALEAELQVAERTIALREQDLDDLVIRAPFPGVVISKNAQPGEMISPNSAGGGFTRTGIATIVDMDSREIEVDVNEAYINRVAPEQRAEARLDAYPDWAIPARVISIVPTADRQRATVRVRLGFEELDPRVLPDMGVKVSFLEERPAAPDPADLPVARIPLSAVRDDGAQRYVWVLRDDRLERRVISIGSAGDGRQDVLAGLRPGEQVVVAGATDPGDLSAGLRVRVEAAR